MAPMRGPPEHRQAENNPLDQGKQIDAPPAGGGPYPTPVAPRTGAMLESDVPVRCPAQAPIQWTTLSLMPRGCRNCGW